MKNNTVDLYIYVPSKENKETTADIANIANHITGVVKAKVNQRVKQLMEVEYNPADVSSQAILSAVRQKGNTATLIGM